MSHTGLHHSCTTLNNLCGDAKKCTANTKIKCLGTQGVTGRAYKGCIRTSSVMTDRPTPVKTRSRVKPSMFQSFTVLSADTVASWRMSGLMRHFRMCAAAATIKRISQPLCASCAADKIHQANAESQKEAHLPAAHK